MAKQWVPPNQRSIYGPDGFRKTKKSIDRLVRREYEILLKEIEQTERDTTIGYLFIRPTDKQVWIDAARRAAEVRVREKDSANDYEAIANAGAACG